ncbi:MAG: M23 family metallopeptidase [Coriobacteriia bacterium]|nr:M23 family metallopeptidase [Coriobacteriia bacterium]
MLRPRRSPRIRMPADATPKLIRSDGGVRDIREAQRRGATDDAEMHWGSREGTAAPEKQRHGGSRTPFAQVDARPQRGVNSRPRSGTNSRLSPVRDAGVAVSGRGDRQRTARQRAVRRNLLVAAILVVCVGVIITGWRYASDRNAAASPLSTLGALFSADASATTNAKAAVVKAPDPTPLFAAYGDVQIRVPVALAQLNEVMFHQASYSYALHMTTTLPDANLNAAANSKGTTRDISTQPKDASAVLVGQVIRVWRTGRTGKPDTSVDVGALAGTQVLAPVTGTVVKIKAYKLYSKYDDFEIHIQPDGHPELDVVMIHVTDITATQGMRVEAGVTPIAAVRLLSNQLHDQLADYSTGTGDHVHIQVNDANFPGYKGLQDAVEAE